MNPLAPLVTTRHAEPPLHAAPQRLGTPPSLRIKAASLADQGAIFELLFRAQRCRSRDDFQEWRDAPNSHVADRLLAWRGAELVGHVHLESRYALFSGERVGVALLRDFVTAAVPDRAELHAKLLAAALEEGQRGGAVVALGEASALGPQAPVIATLASAEVDPHAVLAATGQERRRTTPASSRRVKTEVWRMVDLEQLVALHSRAAGQRWGALSRCDELWQWLLQRETHDDLLADFVGRPATRRMVGYVIRRRGHLLETMTDRARPQPLRRLLRRHARDAMERGDHAVFIHSSRSELAHQWFTQWGGIARSTTETPWAARLLQPERWLERLEPILRHRAKQAGLSLPFEITLGEPAAAFHLNLSRRTIHWTPVGNVVTEIQFPPGGVERLLLGAPPIEPLAHPALAALFPPREWGLTMFDVL